MQHLIGQICEGLQPLFCFGLLEQFDQPIIVFSHHSGVTDNNVGRVNSVQIGGVVPQHFPQGQVKPSSAVIPWQTSCQS